MTVQGFWSYSRAAEEFGGAALHAAMQASLNEILQDDVRIFRDSDRETGISPGRNWAHSIVEALSRSVLFFWVQSPRWLRRTICHFEYGCFCDRVDRLAAAFSVDADRLREHLIVPIRWADVDETAGTRFPEEVPTNIQLAWDRVQVSPSLRLPQVSNGRYLASTEYGPICFAATQDIRKVLSAALQLLGTDLDNVNSFLGRDHSDFVTRWIEEFDWQFPPGGQPPPTDWLRCQRRVAREQNDGHTRQRLDYLGLDMALVPGCDGLAPFWTTAAPLGGPIAHQVAQQLQPDLQPRPGAGGDWLWRAEAAMHMETMLHDADLTLPDPSQARLLRHVFSLPAADLRQLGWTTGYANFWARTATGGVAGSAGLADELPLYLVQAI